jgi:hypothetical protein
MRGSPQPRGMQAGGAASGGEQRATCAPPCCFALAPVAIRRRAAEAPAGDGGASGKAAPPAARPAAASASPTSLKSRSWSLTPVAGGGVSPASALLGTDGAVGRPPGARAVVAGAHDFEYVCFIAAAMFSAGPPEARGSGWGDAFAAAAKGCWAAAAPAHRRRRAARRAPPGARRARATRRAGRRAARAAGPAWPSAPAPWAPGGTGRAAPAGARKCCDTKGVNTAYCKQKTAASNCHSAILHPRCITATAGVSDAAVFPSWLHAQAKALFRPAGSARGAPSARSSGTGRPRWCRCATGRP